MAYAESSASKEPIQMKRDGADEVWEQSDWGRHRTKAARTDLPRVPSRFAKGSSAAGEMTEQFDEGMLLNGRNV